MTNETDKLTFGKYKGRTIGEVLKRDSNYLKWALENVQFFKPSEETRKKISDKPITVREYYPVHCSDDYYPSDVHWPGDPMDYVD